MEVRQANLKVAANQMRLKVRRLSSGALVAGVARGTSFPDEQFTFMLSQLLETREPFIKWLNAPTEVAFTDELAARGYDLATLEFSVEHLLGNAAPFRPARLQRQRSGVLLLCWSREPHDRTGDLCVNWHYPCTKRDVNYIFSWLSMPIAYPQATAGDDNSLMRQLSVRGFDVTSLRLEVRRPTPPTETVPVLPSVPNPQTVLQ